ncbi:MAG: DEAD/DEAH box helicase family protein [Clostridia bacterium]|nr:DEAD/DEAH box helicase family protein [Clostridia bacterium]
MSIWRGKCIELKPHQQRAVNNANKVFVEDNRAIISQLKVSIAKEFGVKPEEYKKVFPNLEITTYQQIASDFKKNKTYAQDFDADLVVFDEAHHTGAPGWGKM